MWKEDAMKWKADDRDKERGHDETNDAGRAATVLEEQGEQWQTERGAHPLDCHDDRQTAQRLLGSRIGHSATLAVALMKGQAR